MLHLKLGDKPFSIPTSWEEVTVKQFTGFAQLSPEDWVGKISVLSGLTRDEILEKWKHRLTYEVMLKNQNEEVVATIYNSQTSSLGTIKRDILNIVHIGQEVNSLYKVFQDKIDKQKYRIGQGNLRSGRVAKISIKMTFRKA